MANANGDQNQIKKSFKNQELFEALASSKLYPGYKNYLQEARKKAFKLFGIQDDHLFTEEQKDKFEDDLQQFVDNVRRRWKKVNRTKHALLSRFSSFFDSNFPFQLPRPNEEWVDVEQENKVPGKKRKIKGFLALSKSGQHRRSQLIVSKNEPEAIIAATKTIFFQKGCRKASAFVLEQMYQDKNFAKTVVKELSAKHPVKVDDDEALALFTSLHQTRNKYQKMRTTAKRHNADIFPPWKKMRAAKKRCLLEDSEYTSSEAVNPTSSLINKSIDRFLSDEENRETIMNFKGDKDSITLRADIKWGLDGSGDQSQYNQQECTGKTLLATQMCIVQYVCEETQQVVYEEPMANTAMAHRPLRLSYEPENRESVCKEYQRVEQDFKDHEPYQPIPGVTFTVNSIPTLFDGKCLKFITHESADQNCAICGAKPTQMSTIGTHFTVKEEPPDVLKHGVAPLHFRLRATDFLLHLGSYSEIQKPQANLEADKISRELREDEIKTDIWERYHVRVFGKGPHGGGVLTGNTARKLFEDPEFLSTTLKVPLEIVLKLKSMCDAVNSSKKIDSAKFEELGTEFNDLFFQHFVHPGKTRSWYFMPSSIHKITVHGKQLLDNLPMAPGLSSEEGSEANNKFFREIRRSLTRKLSSLTVIQDLNERLLCISDPLILKKASKDYLRKKKKRPVPEHLKDLLLDQENAVIEQDDDFHDDAYMNAQNFIMEHGNRDIEDEEVEEDSQSQPMETDDSEPMDIDPS